MLENIAQIVYSFVCDIFIPFDDKSINPIPYLYCFRLKFSIFKVFWNIGILLGLEKDIIPTLIIYYKFSFFPYLWFMLILSIFSLFDFILAKISFESEPKLQNLLYFMNKMYSSTEWIFELEIFHLPSFLFLK